MANDIARIEFISQGFKEILLSDGVGELVANTTERVCEECNALNDRGGEGFESATFKGDYAGGRWVGYISAIDKEARQAASEDKVFERALHP